MSTRVRRAFAMTIVTVWLAACGGSGGGDGADESSPAPGPIGAIDPARQLQQDADARAQQLDEQARQVP